uniref:Uncharacterized protein n=1 Tax=Anguilla anguilla TaxID=7936 RepID=A0A0E9VIU4_ANGAN
MSGFYIYSQIFTSFFLILTYWYLFQ